MFTQQYGHLLVAKVLTNCEDDPHYRVRVKATDIWTDDFPSPLIPSQGHYGPIHLSIGDVVLLNMEYGYDNARIIYKFPNPEQVQNQTRSSFTGLLAWESSYGESNEQWQQFRISKQCSYYENSDGVKISIEPEGVVNVVATNINVTNADTVYVKSPTVTAETDTITVTNSDSITIETNSASVKSELVKVEASDASIKSDSVKVESTNADVKSTNIKLDGKVTFTKGFGAPDSKGPLCTIPNCLFSGAPHSGSMTQP